MVDEQEQEQAQADGETKRFLEKDREPSPTERTAEKVEDEELG